MQKRHVLVTGAAGALGHTVVAALREQGHRVRGYDRALARQPGEHEIGDIQDVTALYRAAREADVIVHLAAIPDRDDFVNKLVPVNIVGTYNVFEVARLRKVPRVVYASSCRVMGWADWERDTLSVADPLSPADHYGVTKAAGELLGSVYAKRHGMSVLCARVGWFVRNPGEASRLQNSVVGQRIYLSHHDAGRFFNLAVTSDIPAFSAVFVTSKNGGNPLGDLKPAGEVLGYEPLDSWPEGSSWSDDLVFPSPSGSSSMLPDVEAAGD